MVCCCDFSGKVPAVGCVDDVLDGLFNFQGSSIIKGSIHHSPFVAVFESRHFDADIPKGAEVIDVCKAVEEMMNESEERGELRMLVQLVRDGDLKLERAAEKAKMTVEQFEKVMENTPLQAV